jgi:uncharacterized protein YycO
MKLKDLRAGSIGVVIDSGSIVEKTIEKATGQGHHVFCYSGNSMITEAHFGKKLEVKPIDYYFSSKMLVLMLEPRKRCFSDAAIAAVCERWAEDVGKPYDFRNVLGFAVGWLRKINDGSRFCSEHAAYGYEGLHKFRGRHYSVCSPHDILFDSYLFGFDKFKPIRLFDLR